MPGILGAAQSCGTAMRSRASGDSDPHPGGRTGAQLEDNLQTFRTEIPAEFQAELKRRGLTREDAPNPQ
jgi:aryl-alcohol dehydrogenase-like predicted oxidoreductase